MEGQPIPPRHPRNPRPARRSRSLVSCEERPPGVDLEPAGKQEQEAGCGEEARVTVDERPRGLRKATSGQDRKGDEQDSAAGRERQTPAPPANELADTDKGRTVNDVVREHGCRRRHGVHSALATFQPPLERVGALVTCRLDLPARASRPCQRRGGQRGAIGSSQNADRLTNVEGNPRGDGSLTRPPGRRAHPMGNADLHPAPSRVVAPARRLGDRASDLLS